MNLQTFVPISGKPTCLRMWKILTVWKPYRCQSWSTPLVMYVAVLCAPRHNVCWAPDQMDGPTSGRVTSTRPPRSSDGAHELLHNNIIRVHDNNRVFALQFLYFWYYNKYIYFKEIRSIKRNDSRKKHWPLYYTAKTPCKAVSTCPRSLPGNSAEANYPRHWWKVWWSKKLGCGSAYGGIADYILQTTSSLLAAADCSFAKQLLEGRGRDLVAGPGSTTSRMPALCWLPPTAALIMRQHQIEGLVWKPCSESLWQMMGMCLCDHFEMKGRTGGALPLAWIILSHLCSEECFWSSC